METIGNRRYVVRGECGARKAPILATNDREEAARVCREGRVIAGRYWSGVEVHDRRLRLLPAGGWYA